MVPLFHILLDNCWHFFHFYRLAVDFNASTKYLAWWLVCLYFNASLYFWLCLSIIQYVSGNMSPYTLSLQYISSKVSPVTLLSLMSNLINRTLLKAYTVSSPYSYIYLIVGSYSSNINLFLLWNSHAWVFSGTYSVILCTNIIARKYFRISAILNSSFI